MKETVRNFRYPQPHTGEKRGNTRLSLSFFYTFLTATLLLLTSCGTDSGKFHIKGRLLNINQGEFYVYSTDGLIDAVDTIQVVAGRFTYSTPCTQPGTLIVIFPNFSEQPVFAQPGKSVDFEGDAHKLKELKITGTKENKLMNGFREQIASASPQETRHAVELFIENHPESIVGQYLVRRYFIVCQNPDYKTASRLYAKLMEAQPDNGRLKQQYEQIKAVSNAGKLPSFTFTDTDGKKLTSQDFAKGDAIIYVWASWEYESQNIQRYISDVAGDTIMTLGISLDASRKACDNMVKRNNIKNHIYCDGKMFDGTIVRHLGISSIPANIILKNGKIVARDLTYNELRDRFKK